MWPCGPDSRETLRIGAESPRPAPPAIKSCPAEETERRRYLVQGRLRDFPGFVGPVAQHLHDLARIVGQPGLAFPYRSDQRLQDLFEVLFHLYVAKPAAPVPGLQLRDRRWIVAAGIEN